MFVLLERMFKHMNGLRSILSLFFLFSTASLSFGELRWCKTLNTSSIPAQEIWTRYNDTVQTCLTCSGTSVRLVDVDEVDNYECCGGTIVRAETCSIYVKESGRNCSNAMEVCKVKCNFVYMHQFKRVSFETVNCGTAPDGKSYNR